MVLPEEVSVSIAEYRPVYLAGDIEEPGEQTFRPGLTVRQAVAIAGGYDLLAKNVGNPVLRSIELRAQYAALANEHAKETARTQRLEQELRLPRSASPAPIPSDNSLTEITDVEEELRQLRDTDHGKEKAFVKSTLERTELRITQLEKQYEYENEGLRLDTEEVARMEELRKKGLVTEKGILEARRALLLSSTRTLQTSVQAEQAKREREELRSKLLRLDDQRRIEGLSELQDARAKARALQVRLDAIAQELLLIGGGPTGDANPSIEIIRTAPDGGREKLTVDEDAPLMPGDVIQVEIASAGGRGSM
ncbi:SLBB domain-containing protein [Sinorhizobium meliloti]|uniref:SLBB domain-containing protein n=1 Tax=Rhizobium meliloti TaxID=382 RepID=UPI0020909B30|nr:SLBB domain-containing protein [Sinorhizobium meliloti]MCO5965395.1 SLBB domain-containing protein [Sinorhizobium meliloti]